MPTNVATTWREEPLVSDLAGQLAHITAPTLVVAGELDMDFIREQARLLADQIPRAQLELLSDTAHAPSIERPGAFDDLVMPFLARTMPDDLDARQDLR
jgi:pimeloyl-ACP methyl ester carboxylesterase